MLKLVFLVIFVLLFSAQPGYAYIGPGMAGGAILASIGLVFGLLIALLSLIILPVRRLYFKAKNKKKKRDD